MDAKRDAMRDMRAEGLATPRAHRHGGPVETRADRVERLREADVVAGVCPSSKRTP